MTRPHGPSRVVFGLVAGMLAITLAAVMLVVQLVAIHQLWTPVGLVDPWPLYDRMLRLATHQITFDHYLLDPHVHPHAIVYGLYMIDARLASGRQGVPHIATLVCILALIGTMGALFWRMRLHPPGSPPSFRLLALMAGTAILLSGLSEATIVPFQCVVVVTRFVYVALLAVLVWCQFRPRPWLQAAALAASMVAITFYASAGVFAVLIILVHLLAVRRVPWLLASVLPLAAYLLLLHLYPPPIAEATAVKDIVMHLQPVTLLRLAAGAASYYATPLVDGWWAPLIPGWSASVTTITAVGGIVCVGTTSWATVTLIRRFVGQFRADDVPGPYAAPQCLMALLSLWVLISAVSAALLWLARQRIVGAAMTTPIHYVVLASLRYGAFAALAYITVLFIAARMRNQRAGTALAAGAFVLIGANAVHARLDADRVNAHIAERSALDLASTSLLMGLPPTRPDSSAAWQGVAADTYWLMELPRTTQFLRDHNLGYAHDVPTLGQVWPDARLPLTAVATVPSPGETQVCRITAVASSFRPSGFFPHRVFALMQADGVVVGYGLREGVGVEGHVLCGAMAAHPLLFIAGTS